MLQYIDKIDVFNTEVNDKYIYNVMQGNIEPNTDDDFLNNDFNEFDSLELFKQLEMIYGKNFINQQIHQNRDVVNYNNEQNDNYRRENDEEEIILHLPSSKEDEEIDIE